MFFQAVKNDGVRFYPNWHLEFKNRLFQVQSQVKSRYHYSNIFVSWVRQKWGEKCKNHRLYWRASGTYLHLIPLTPRHFSPSPGIMNGTSCLQLAVLQATSSVLRINWHIWSVIAALRQQTLLTVALAFSGADPTSSPLSCWSLWPTGGKITISRW